MNYALATSNIIPQRAQSDDRSEMVSQFLFGEIMEVIETKNSWCYVRNLFDDYAGWVDSKQITFIDEIQVRKILESEIFYTKEIVTNIYDLETKQEIRILFGSNLIGYTNGKINIANKDYVIRESPLALTAITTRDSIVSNAKKFLGAPYLWGGKNPFGIDCSGFTQTVFKVCGINIPRDASQQALHGELVDFIGDATEGDLAFFENDSSQVIHVGIVLRNSKIIHASGQVRIDVLDHNGIFNEKLKTYTHKLRIIKKFI